MVQGIKDSQILSKEKIDDTFSDLGLGGDDIDDFRSTSFHLGSLSLPPDTSSFGGQLGTYRSEKPKKGFIRRLRSASSKGYKLKDIKSIQEDFKSKLEDGEDHLLHVDGVQARDTKGLRGTPRDEKLEFSIESLEEGPEEVYLAEIAEVVSARVSEPAEFELGIQLEKDIEEIVKERWRYLVMQFGGVFLTEIRPNRCFIDENKTLADRLIIFNEKENRYRLDIQLLGKYLRKNSNGKRGKIQIHFSNIMFNPRINDYDLFSITSGDIGKAGIFVDLARFLREYNKGEKTIIPVHLPYYEKWKTSEKVIEFGRLDADGERDAVHNADKVLRHLEEKLGKNVKLALETGNGESRRDGQIAYALIYKPFYFQSLTDGRGNLVSLCEDVGHLNLENAKVNWKDYLTEEISEFHVSGNNGKEDQHTIATPKTLKDYARIMSFLKFYAGNICAEVGKGQLTSQNFLRGVKNLAYVLFSEPTKIDFDNLREIESYVRVTRNGEIDKRNLNQERYVKYQEYVKATLASS